MSEVAGNSKFLKSCPIFMVWFMPTSNTCQCLNSLSNRLSSSRLFLLNVRLFHLFCYELCLMECLVDEIHSVRICCYVISSPCNKHGFLYELILLGLFRIRKDWFSSCCFPCMSHKLLFALQAAWLSILQHSGIGCQLESSLIVLAI